MRVLQWHTFQSSPSDTWVPDCRRTRRTTCGDRGTNTAEGMNQRPGCCNLVVPACVQSSSEAVVQIFSRN